MHSVLRDPLFGTDLKRLAVDENGRFFLRRSPGEPKIGVSGYELTAQMKRSLRDIERRAG
jgi:hypothetical protein